MLYRESGQFKTSYKAGLAIFPIEAKGFAHIQQSPPQGPLQQRKPHQGDDSGFVRARLLLE